MFEVSSRVAVSLICISGICLAGDWPQWRGPNRDGISKETGLLTEWPAGGPELKWKVTGLGAGFSSVSLAGDRIFTAGDIGDSSFIVALNRANGKVLWKTKLGQPGGGPAGPRGTPSTDGNLVFALGQNGELVCVEASSGKEVWRKNLAKEFGGKFGGWLYSESPLVDGDRLICTPGGNQGTLMAFNKKTGEVLWRCKEWTDNAEYSSAIVETLGGIRQYIQFTGNSVAGVATDSGKLLWRADRPGRTATVPTPICKDNRVYVTSGYGVGCNLFKITAEGDQFKTELVYANTNMVNHHGGVVLVGQYLYGYSDGKGWICQDFKSGEILWKNPGVGKGAIAYADKHLYLRSEGSSGTVALIEATPQAYKETGRFDQPDRSGSESWAHPVIAGGCLYLRDQDLLLCYDLSTK
ncbi:MAG: PQQ-binding-like beta-propeller repeat protein [Phycisphaerae bacterium]|nr:PQQ-binding-like beta-propeller repeat protein [Phycisphaerae bacterium]